MLCEKCNRNKATIHLTEIIKNTKSEVHLCEECAREIGLNSKLSNFSLSIPDFLSFLDLQTEDEPLFPDDKSVCLSCGKSLTEIRKSGMTGCADCYHYFSQGIDKFLLEHFNNNRHCGKTPQNFESPDSSQVLRKPVSEFMETDDLHMLETMLQRAVEDERYEDAALIRNRIEKFSRETL